MAAAGRMALAVASPIATPPILLHRRQIRAFPCQSALQPTPRRLNSPSQVPHGRVHSAARPAIQTRSLIVTRGAGRTRPGRLPRPRASIDVRTASADSSSEKAAAAMGSKIEPAVIVGGGRVGQALEKMGGGQDVVVRRGQSVPADSQGPIIVCTRNDALSAIIDSTPPSRRQAFEEAGTLAPSEGSGDEPPPAADAVTDATACIWALPPCVAPLVYVHENDLVFIQNGMLEPFLESKGLEDATIVLVYFAVAKAGDPPLDGKTDLNPEGLTAASGKWAPAIAARLHSAGLSCKVLDTEEFKKPLLEKLIWIAAFMLVGARHPGATVGVVEQEYRDEVVSLIKELSAAAESEKKIKFNRGVDERLCSYARSVAHFPTAVKEFEWRNGWFYGISQRAIAGGKSDPLPLHTAWLKEVGAIKD